MAPKQVERVEKGQRYRDQDGALWDVAHVEPNGDAWVRSPAQKSATASILTRAAWFERWELLPDSSERGEG